MRKKENIFYYFLIWKDKVFCLRTLMDQNHVVRCQVIYSNNQQCTSTFGKNEGRDYLFMRCDLYGKLWMLVSSWLEFSAVTQDNLKEHLAQFGGLGGFWRHIRLAFHIIWPSIV